MAVLIDPDLGWQKYIDGGPDRSGFRSVKILMVVLIDPDLGGLYTDGGPDRSAFRWVTY